MPALPRDVESLLAATDQAAQERAWVDFLQQRSAVVLRVARALGRGRAFGTGNGGKERKRSRGAQEPRSSDGDGWHGVSHVRT